MIKTYETARSHSLPLSKKRCWHLKSSMGYIYIYMLSPPKQNKNNPPPPKKKNRTMGIAGSPMGLVSSCFLVLFFSLIVFLFFLFSPRNPPQRVSKHFFLVQGICLFSARDPPQRVSEYCCVFVCMKMYV